MSEQNMKLYAVYAPDQPGRHVFQDWSDAKKLCSSPSSRFKICTSEADVDGFYEMIENIQPIGDGDANTVEPKAPYSEPKGILLSRFRVLIEKKDNENFDKFIQENPRYLVNTSGEKPTILHNGIRHNSLHVACQNGNLYVVKRVLSLICSSEFMVKAYGSNVEIGMKCAHFLDLYLNLPDKNANNTPLHIAAKAGHVDIIKELLEYKELVKEPLNKYGEKPSDVAATGMKGATELEKRRTAETIVNLLKSQLFYIAFYRLVGETGRPQHVIFKERPAVDLYEIAEDHLKSCLRSESVNIEAFNKQLVKYFDSIGPSGDFIGSALDLSMDSSLSSSGSPVSVNGSSLARRRAFREYKMTCYLGPFLEEDECQKCCLKWLRTNKDVCLTKPLNGYEKVGRELADEFKIEFVDLSPQEEDEEFFDAMPYNDENINQDVDEDEFFDAPQEFASDVDELSDLFTQKCLVKSPLRTGNR